MKAKTQQTESKDHLAHQRRPAKPNQDGLAVNAQQADPHALQLAVQDPAQARPATILALQRAAGNEAVSRLIQTKLTVGGAGDRYEQEADRVAEQVVGQQSSASGVQHMASGEPQAMQRQEDEEEIQTKPLAASITPVVQRQAEEEEEIQTKSLVQRQAEEEEIQTKPLVQRQAEEEEEIQTKSLVQRQAEEEEEIQTKPLVQRQAEEEEEIQTKPLLQRRTHSDGSFDAGPGVESSLAAHRGGGSPLPAPVRTFMEPRFGADFSRVRLHSDSSAVQLNRALNAQAFTNGSDIYLGEHAAAPTSPAGQKLLAHELTHVIQQGGANNRIARWGKPHGGTGHDELTKEAFATLEPEIKRWYSSEAQEYLAGYSESIDMRIGFLGGSWLVGKMYEYLGYKPAKALGRGLRKAGRGITKGTKNLGLGLGRGLNMMTFGKLGISKGKKKEIKNAMAMEEAGQTESEKRRIATAYNDIKWYWRKASEAPNHGEGGKYQGDGASVDAARVNAYIESAVKAWKGKNKNQALSILGLALHATQDRGAHGDGKPGTGHDPRLSTPPPNEYARQDLYDPNNDGANCDRRGQNSEGWDFAVGFTQEVLANFAYGIGLSGSKDLNEQDLEVGAKLKAFEKPNKLKRFGRKTGIFFGKDVIKL